MWKCAFFEFFKFFSWFPKIHLQVCLQDSFSRSCKVIGRALNEDIDIFINYTKDPYEKAVASDDLLHLAQVYHDELWTAKRLVTGMAFSEHYPDLLAVSYGPCDVPNEPPGVIVVWNTKSKRITAEWVLSITNWNSAETHLILSDSSSTANRKFNPSRSPVSMLTCCWPAVNLDKFACGTIDWRAGSFRSTGVRCRRKHTRSRSRVSPSSAPATPTTLYRWVATERFAVGMWTTWRSLSMERN